eukprot:747290-Pelagomonas_calceolata.AAC.2
MAFRAHQDVSKHTCAAITLCRRAFPDAVALSLRTAAYLASYGDGAIDIDNIAQRITVDVIDGKKKIYARQKAACIKERLPGYGETENVGSRLLVSFQVEHPLEGIREMESTLCSTGLGELWGESISLPHNLTASCRKI